MLDGPACFNPLDRGNLYQISYFYACDVPTMEKFQSPRSGKFVSDNSIVTRFHCEIFFSCFNPLDRGNLYQI